MLIEADDMPVRLASAKRPELTLRPNGSFAITVDKTSGNWSTDGPDLILTPSKTTDFLRRLEGTVGESELKTGRLRFHYSLESDQLDWVTETGTSLMRFGRETQAKGDG